MPLAATFLLPSRDILAAPACLSGRVRWRTADSPRGRGPRLEDRPPGGSRAAELPTGSPVADAAAPSLEELGWPRRRPSPGDAGPGEALAGVGLQGKRREESAARGRVS